MRLQHVAPALAGLLLAVAACARPVPDARALEEVVAAIEKKDCAAAAARLNEGMAEGRAALLLMAGAMYEEGICLTQNWDRAARYYQRAHEAGDHSALPRLVAGNALHGRDAAAALWWAMQGSLALPADCQLPPALLPDPEAFAAALTAWPAGRLAACVYTAGVLGAVAGDVEFPGRAESFGVGGTVEMSFVPSAGTIAWRKTADDVLPLQVVTGEFAKDRESAARAALVTYLQGVGERVLRRYERPSGIDPAWQPKMRFVFRFEP